MLSLSARCPTASSISSRTIVSLPGVPMRLGGHMDEYAVQRDLRPVGGASAGPLSVLRRWQRGEYLDGQNSIVPHHTGRARRKTQRRDVHP